MAGSGYKQYRVEIGGDTLIMHNGQTADPLNKFAKAMKEISGKRKKTDADHQALADIEFRAGLYVDQQGRVILPGRVYEAALAIGARQSKEGKLALSGLFVDNDAVLEYDGGPLTVDQLVASESHRLSVAVRVSTSKVIRTRPIFRAWKATFVLSVDSTVANEASVRRWVQDTGSRVGVGDWRPRHGRYDLLAFAEMKAPLSMAA
jgi:hypothetical protein